MDARIKRLEQQLEDLRQALEIPGISAAIVKEQKLLWAGIGFADVENRVHHEAVRVHAPDAAGRAPQAGSRRALAKYSPEFRQRFGGRSTIARRVFTHTSHDPSGAGLARLAKPYRLQGTETVRGLYPSRGISAAAGLVSNILDLVKYDVAIDGHTLVRAETQERVDAGEHARRQEAAGTEDRVDPPREQRRAERAVLPGRRRRYPLAVRRQLSKNLRARGESRSDIA